MKKSLLDKAYKIALSKLDSHPEYLNFLHYSFIIQRNQIVEWATNIRLEPPRHYGYHRQDDKAFRPKYHSEVFAYKKARGLLKDASFELINIRFSRTRALRMSRPCKACFNLMTILGCVKFYYSTNGNFQCLIQV